MIFWKRLAGVAVCLLLGGCAAPPLPSAPPTETGAPVIDRTLVASLLIVGVSTVAEAREALQDGAGGIFLPSWSEPELLSSIASLRKEIGRDFDVAIDFEGGRVQRHSDVLGSFPAPATLPKENIRATASDIGRRLASYGITVDFAPVLDVDTAGLDIIGDRSFGTTPQQAASGAIAFAQGLLDAGVQPVYKHFPGHGAASGDTHLGAATTPPLPELETLDLAAYGPALTEASGAAVMMGHLNVPGLTTGPASLDPAAYQLLRSGDYPGGVPFQGRIYTDDLSGMAAIAQTPQEAAREAIAAGADRALWSSGGGLNQAVDLIVTDVVAGKIPYENLVAAAYR